MQLGRSRALVLVGLLIAVALFQAPNLALIAYKLGFPLADTRLLGIDITVKNGWYPVASHESVLGKAIFSQYARPIVAFHRPSIVWPWREEGFAVIPYVKPVEASSVELVRDMPWGRAQLLKAAPSENPARRLYAIPEVRVGIIVDDPKVLDDVVSLRKQ